jgi:heme-degrading monooxygenase HmoA
VICALTVRRLKPGTFEQFREAFMKPLESSDRPDGLVRFAMVRNIDEADEVICFGLFDGTVEELRAGSEAAGRKEQQEAIGAFVESVGADGVYEVVEDISNQPSAPAG